MKHSINCLHCESRFDIWTYSLGMSDLAEFRCTKCPITLGIDPPYDRPLSDVVLPQCPCGGAFSRDSAHRCPICCAELTMESIKSQIAWRGSKDGVPGVTVTKMVSLDGLEFQDPGGVAPAR
jgi:hypothetical protein